MALRKFGEAGLGGVGEPTGRKGPSEKWQSLMALRKFGEADLGGGVGEPTVQKRRTKKSKVRWHFGSLGVGSGGLGSRPAGRLLTPPLLTRWHCGSLVRRVWRDVGEPTGRKRRTKKNEKSPMALRKLGGAGLGGRETNQPKAPVRKMAKSDGIAEVW